MIFDLPPRCVAPHVPTPDEVVRVALQIAQVTADDLVLDLGCGDGRVPIAAARDFGALGCGIDIDFDLLRQGRLEADRDNVGGRVLLVQADLAEFALSRADVVFLYLTSFLMKRLALRLETELARRTRVVTYQLPLPGWSPAQVVPAPTGPPHQVYLYRRA